MGTIGVSARLAWPRHRKARRLGRRVNGRASSSSLRTKQEAPTLAYQEAHYRFLSSVASQVTRGKSPGGRLLAAQIISSTRDGRGRAKVLGATRLPIRRAMVLSLSTRRRALREPARRNILSHEVQPVPDVTSRGRIEVGGSVPTQVVVGHSHARIERNTKPAGCPHRSIRRA